MVTVSGMGDDRGFDPTFDFKTEAGEGDPDQYSPTLRAYHKLLWSKPLPNGDLFELDDSKPPPHLHHLSARGEFDLTSDSAMQTWIMWDRVQIRRITDGVERSEREDFLAIAHQIGGKVLFPGRRTGDKPTINQERGTNEHIFDRFDLTLECIRLHYLGETSPLADTLNRYGDFFALFEDFHGYTDFFLLQDLVPEDSSTVKFLIPFSDFTASPFPSTVEEYQHYRENGISFVQSRNRRMSEYVAQL
jgi:hypothetical protein